MDNRRSKEGGGGYRRGGLAVNGEERKRGVGGKVWSNRKAWLKERR